MGQNSRSVSTAIPSRFTFTLQQVFVAVGVVFWVTFTRQHNQRKEGSPHGV